MAEVLAELAAQGYTDSFRLEDGVRCPDGCSGVPTIDATWRFEGISDPDDESIVLALTCASCQRRGVLTAAYGPWLGGPEADALASLKRTAGSEPS
jgi:hypothetical protein